MVIIRSAQLSLLIANCLLSGNCLLYFQLCDLDLQLDRDAAKYVLEDTRLSTLQRKLVKEGDESVAVALALHINECLLYPENSSYVSRSSDLIQDGIMEVMRSPDHSWHVKQLCALGVGRVGSLHPNYVAWVSWVWKQYESCENERLQTLYLTALEESILRDGGNKEGITKEFRDLPNPRANRSAGIQWSQI